MASDRHFQTVQQFNILLHIAMSFMTNIYQSDDRRGQQNRSCNTCSACQKNNGEYSFETIEQSADYIFSKIKTRPKIGVICGSGLGSLATILHNPITINYGDIPNFPKSSVSGHAGELVLGDFNGETIICMKGRFHYYEGHPLQKCCMPIRVMKMLGVLGIILSNAAGSLNPEYQVGDIMIIRDHINFMGFSGNNPLQGLSEKMFGSRFVSMKRAYNKALIGYGKQLAKKMAIEDHVKVGIYTCLGGPNYETGAEITFLRSSGVDAVGMSTVHEVITARHCDMVVFAFSLITNICSSDDDNDDDNLTHDHVLKNGKNREQIVQQFVTGVIEEMLSILANK